VGYLCFPHLYSPAVNKQNPAQPPRFSCILLFDKTGTQSAPYQDLRAAVMAAVTEKWGQAKAQDPNFIKSLRFPFRPAAEKDYGGFDKGEIYISPWTSGEPGKAPPDVVDLNGRKITVPSDVFPGQLARATVRAFAYDSNGNKGVSFGLEHVQIVKADMPRFDGRTNSETAFAAADNAQLAALGIEVNDPAPATSAVMPDGLPF